LPGVGTGACVVVVVVVVDMKGQKVFGLRLDTALKRGPPESPWQESLPPGNTVATILRSIHSQSEHK